MDDYVNFGITTVAVAPSPATSGLSLTVATGGGAKLPVPPFDLVVCPAGAQPNDSQAEFIRVTSKTGDVLTIGAGGRAQQGTTARSIVVGDVIGRVWSKKDVDDLLAASSGGAGVVAAPYTIVDGGASHTPTAGQAILNSLTAPTRLSIHKTDANGTDWSNILSTITDPVDNISGQTSYETRGYLRVVKSSVSGIQRGARLLSAAPSSGWNRERTVNAPPARWGHGIAYDTIRKKIVVFGGRNASYVRNNETWEYDIPTNTWTQITTANAPSARYGMGMTFHKTRGVVMLFGGNDATGNKGDTWEYDGTNWTDVSPATSPSARNDTCMVYHTVDAAVILFGGGNTNETWRRSSGNWVQQFPAFSPPTSNLVSMCDDTVRDEVVLISHGGQSFNDPVGYYLKVYTWDRTNWTAKTVATNVSIRDGCSFTFNDDTGLGYLIGGDLHFSPFTGEVYTWNGSNLALHTGGINTHRQSFCGAAIYAKDYKRIFTFGGMDSYGRVSAETWSLSPPNVIDFAFDSVVSNGTLAAGDPVIFSAQKAGKRGDAGRAAGALCMEMLFSASVTAGDPGAGYLRLSPNPHHSATSIYISNTDRYGAGFTTLINHMKTAPGNLKGYLTLVDAGRPEISQAFYIINNIVNNGTYTTLSVTGLNQPGFAWDQQPVTAIFQPIFSGWNTLSADTDQLKTNSASLSDDAKLIFAMLASTKYRIRGKIFFDTTAAGDFKYAFAGPIAPTLVRGRIITCPAGGTPVETTIQTGLPSGSLVGTGTTGGFIEFDFIFHNSTQTGNFRFQFAQDTATASESATRLAGSYMEYNVA